MSIVTPDSGTIIAYNSITEYIYNIVEPSIINSEASSNTILVVQPDPTIVVAGHVGPSGKDAEAKSKNPIYTYNVDGTLNRVDYADSSYKTFTWLADRLSAIVYVKGTVTISKQYIYNLDGMLVQIIEI